MEGQIIQYMLVPIEEWEELRKDREESKNERKELKELKNVLLTFVNSRRPLSSSFKELEKETGVTYQSIYKWYNKGILKEKLFDKNIVLLSTEKKGNVMYAKYKLI